MSIRAIRAPDGDPRRPGGPPPSVRDNVNPPWPGITAPRCDGRNECTWAWHRGRMELKYLNAMCMTHRRRAA